MRLAFVFLSVILIATVASAQSMHDHNAHAHEIFEVPETMAVPTVQLEVTQDTKAGWNVRIQTANFVFSPQGVNQEHVDGEGHAHIYVNGEKLNRVYSEWYHIPSLPTGEHEISVTLNSNDHREFAINNEVIVDYVTVIVEGEASMNHHGSARPWTSQWAASAIFFVLGLVFGALAMCKKKN